MQAVVNKIIPFSAVDGPGNRSVVFLQGCNLDCKYCHNPETRAVCIHCGNCVKACQSGALKTEQGEVFYDEVKCIRCDACIRVCPHDSTPKTKVMSPLEVFHLIQKQIPFISGITVSGGECTLYQAFIEELFILCQSAGLTTMIDSNGMFDFSGSGELLKVTDGVMLDIKAFDEKQHIEVTGAENKQILHNAVLLAECGKLYEVRTVVVPGLFDAKETIQRTGKLLKPYLTLKDIRYKIIAYRPMGVRKAYAHYEVPDQKYLKSLELLLREEGFQNIIII